MPNPFPGMDPYLENPTDWQGFHNALITHMAEAIQAVLPPAYVAKVEARCLIERSDAAITVRPDIAVVEPERGRVSAPPGSLAVLERMAQSDPPLRLRVFPLVHVPKNGVRNWRPRGRLAKPPRRVRSFVPGFPYPISGDVYLEERQAYLNILDRRGRQVITAIEILSPTNKNTRDDGHAVYIAKQREILASRAALLEIDLLRGGAHTAAVPLSAIPADRSWDYLMCLHRGERGYEYEVWPSRLREPLPRTAIPLGGADPDIIFDLQALLTQTYGANRYDADLDYSVMPTPPLRPDDAAWADALLRKRDLRP